MNPSHKPNCQPPSLSRQILFFVLAGTLTTGCHPNSTSNPSQTEMNDGEKTPALTPEKENQPKSEKYNPYALELSCENPDGSPRKIGEERGQWLCDLIDFTSPAQQQEAAKKLAKEEGEDITETLMMVIIKSTVQSVQITCLLALSEKEGSKVTLFIADRLYNPILSGTAASILGRRGDEESIKALMSIEKGECIKSIYLWPAIDSWGCREIRDILQHVGKNEVINPFPLEIANEFLGN